MARTMTMTEEHFRKGVTVITWPEVKALVLAEAMRRAGVEAASVASTVRYEDATEGSPAYKIGVQFVVTLVENLMEPADDHP